MRHRISDDKMKSRKECDNDVLCAVEVWYKGSLMPWICVHHREGFVFPSLGSQVYSLLY